MCKTKMKTNLYYANICKHEHENNMTRIWCKIVPKIAVEQTKGNEGSYSYLYPFEDLTQRASEKVFICASSKEASWEPS
jgi:hypothetical protein